MYQSNNARESIPYNIESSNIMQRRMPLAQPLGLERKDSTSQQKEVEGIYRLENLNQNLNQLVNKYELASIQLKETVDMLKRQQPGGIGQRPSRTGQVQVDRQGSAFSITSLVHDEQEGPANAYKGNKQDLHAQLKPSFSKESFGLHAGAQLSHVSGQPAVQNLRPSPLAQLARPHDIRQALNPSIQEHDQDVEASDCDVDDSLEAGNADGDDLGHAGQNNYGSRIHVNETSQDFYQSQVGKPRGRSIHHNDVQKH